AQRILERFADDPGDLQAVGIRLDLVTAMMLDGEKLILRREKPVDFADVEQSRSGVRVARVEGSWNIGERNIRFTGGQGGDGPVRQHREQTGRGQSSAQRLSAADLFSHNFCILARFRRTGLPACPRAKRAFFAAKGGPKAAAARFSSNSRLK